MTRPIPETDSALWHRGWTVRHSSGSARWFHEQDPEADTDHEIWIHAVERPAVIFGSTQLPSGFRSEPDVSGPDIEVCRRRSGGGLVIARPDDVWIDAVVPRHSPLHHDDVGRAFEWLGQVWLDTLRQLLAGSSVDGGRDGPLHVPEPPTGRRAADRPFFCFADVGHGEVLFGERKIVGISQRRTRDWTRLQSLLIATWDATANDALVAEALRLVGRRDVDRAELGGPPHGAAEVKAGFAVGATPFRIGRDLVADGVIRGLPAVGGAD